MVLAMEVTTYHLKPHSSLKFRVHDERGKEHPLKTLKVSPYGFVDGAKVGIAYMVLLVVASLAFGLEFGWNPHPFVLRDIVDIQIL